MNRVISWQRLFPFFFALGMILCSYVIPSEAQTVARGRITTNTTWTASNNPYEVPVAIIISKDVTLTIEPGVTVNMGTGATITVEGELVARGKEDALIKFTGGGGTPGGWGTIRFMEGAKSATFTPEEEYANGSILEHCVIEFGGGGGGIDDAAVRIWTVSPYLKDCVFRNNKRPIYYGRGYADGDQGLLHRLRDCVFLRNENGIIANARKLDFRDCIFVVNHSAAGGAAIDATWSTISFISCSFFSNSAPAGAINISLGTADLIGCQFIKNSSANTGSGGAISAWDSTLNLITCSFIQNSSTESGAIHTRGNTNMNLATCTFLENSGVSVIGFSGNGSAKGCAFQRNQSTKGIVYTSGLISFNENVFSSDNKAPYLLFFDRQGADKLDARNTYWGIDKIDEILFKLIFHHFVNAAYGEVLIEPIKTSKEVLFITFPEKGAMLESGKSYPIATWMQPLGNDIALRMILINSIGKYVKRLADVRDPTATTTTWAVDVEPGGYMLMAIVFNKQKAAYILYSDVFSVETAGRGGPVSPPSSVQIAPRDKAISPPPTQLAVVGNLIKPENVSSVEITGKAKANVQVNVILKDGANTAQKTTTSDSTGLFKAVMDATSLKDGNITVIASEVGGQEASITVIKDTKPSEKPDFLISALNQAQSTEVGKSAIYIINLLSRGGFKSELTLRIADAPKGIESEFNPKVVSISAENPLNSSQLTIRVGNEASVGDYKFIVSAVAADKSIKEIELQLQVKPPSLKSSLITIDYEPTQPKLEDKLKVKGEVILFEGEVKTKLPITISYRPPAGETIIQSLQTDEMGKYISEFEIKQKGKWEITASWVGDKTYKPAQKAVSIEVSKGLSQIAWKPLQVQTATSESIKLGSVIKIVGSLQSLIKKEPLKAETIQIDIIKPAGTKRVQKVNTSEFGGFEFDVQFDSEGTWQIEASWEGNADYLPSKSEALLISARKENPKAIIVLGGGSESEISRITWNLFAGLANYVYRILKRRDLTDDDIYYLSPTEKPLASVDSKPSKEALKFAITDWAKKRTSKNVPLFIYLLSHNLDDKFLLEKSKEREVVLTPEDLASWLDELDKDVEVTLIIEACFSGNFIVKKKSTGEPILSKSNRVIITSAKEDKQALVLKDLSSFSRAFFNQIARNESIYTAFLRGTNSIGTSRSKQTPQIDANGDGRPNDPTRDYPAVEKKYIPEFRQYLASVPEIKEIIATPSELKVGKKSATIEVKVVGTNISDVTADILPPNFNPNITFNSWDDLNSKFDQIKLQMVSEGVYKEEYDNFVLPGEYSIVVNAENPDGSAIPTETRVKVLSLPWDVSPDGEVNIFDLVIVAKNIGLEVKEGDVNGDGKVDILDLVTVANHFGEKSTAAAPSTESTQIDYSQYLPILERAYQLLQASSASASSNYSSDFELARRLLERLISLAKSVVKETKLFPNYPNPFNPETWIPYQLAEKSDVIVRIYNSTGRLVRTLRLGRKEPGIYLSKDRAAYWDGRNDVGEYISSGVYLYELTAGKYRSVKKMVVLK